MKGDTSVDPTERPNSKLTVPFQQPALIVVASAAAEDSRSQLTCITSAIAPDDQVVCMKSTSPFDQSITSSPSTIFEYTCLHFAPARRSLYFSDGPARTLGALCPFLARTTVELCSSPELYPSPAASSNPLKMDAASPIAAVPLGKLRGSECSGSTGTACTSSWALGCSTFPATPREIPGPRPEDLRGRRRSRLFETICCCAPGGALGRATASFGNPRGTDGPSRGAALAEGSAFEEPRLRGRDRARLLDGTTAGAPTGSFGNPRGTDGPSRGGTIAEGSAFEESRLRGRDRARLLDGTTAGAPTGSFGNPRGTDGPSRGETLAEGSAFEEPRLRGRDRARLLDGTTAGAPTGSFGNPRGTDGPSRGGTLAEGSAFEEPRLRARDRARLLDDTTAGAPGGAFGRANASFGNPRGTDGSS